MAKKQKKETTRHNAAILVELIPGESGFSMEIKVGSGSDPEANRAADAIAELIRKCAMYAGAKETK